MYKSTRVFYPGRNKMTKEVFSHDTSCFSFSAQTYPSKFPDIPLFFHIVEQMCCNIFMCINCSTHSGGATKNPRFALKRTPYHQSTVNGWGAETAHKTLKLTHCAAWQCKDWPRCSCIPRTAALLLDLYGDLAVVYVVCCCACVVSERLSLK